MAIGWVLRLICVCRAATPHPSAPVLRAAEGTVSLTTNRVLFEADQPAASPGGVVKHDDASFLEPFLTLF